MAIGDKRTCNRCSYGWVSIREDKPRSCPSCKSRQWDTPYQERYSHYCENCQTNWEGPVPHPKRCPACSSLRWDKRKELNRV